MKRLLLFLLIIPSICFSQEVTHYKGNTKIIPIENNVILVEKLRGLLQILEGYDGVTEINIPTYFQVRKNKKYFTGRNHISEYDYDQVADKITYGDNDVLVITINFTTKAIDSKWEKGNEKDHYKPKDKDEKIKKKEKMKPKSLKPIIIR